MSWEEQGNSSRRIRPEAMGRTGPQGGNNMTSRGLRFDVYTFLVCIVAASRMG